MPAKVVAMAERWTCTGCGTEASVKIQGAYQGTGERPVFENEDAAFAAGWTMPRRPECHAPFCPACAHRAGENDLPCVSCYACAVKRKKEREATP